MCKIDIELIEISPLRAGIPVNPEDPNASWAVMSLGRLGRVVSFDLTSKEPAQAGTALYAMFHLARAAGMPCDLCYRDLHGCATAESPTGFAKVLESVLSRHEKSRGEAGTAESTRTQVEGAHDVHPLHVMRLAFMEAAGLPAQQR